MRRSNSLTPWLPAVALLAAVLPARAADLDKYLLDDADGVLTVNVKQALASPLYTKHLQKPVEGMFQSNGVREFLKDTGFAPLKDVDHVTVVQSPSCPHLRSGEWDFVSPTVPFTIIRGNWDEAKLKVVAEKAAQGNKQKPTEHKAGDARYWQMPEGRLTYYLAVPEKGTVVIAGTREQVIAALETGAGTRKPALKNRALADLLDKGDAKATVRWAATSSFITHTRYDAKTQVAHTTLADNGITTVSGDLTIGDDIKGQTTIVSNDAVGARELAATLNKAVGQGIAECTRYVKEEKEAGPLLDALKNVQVSAKDKTIHAEGEVKAEAVVFLLTRLR